MDLQSERCRSCRVRLRRDGVVAGERERKCPPMVAGMAEVSELVFNTVNLRSGLHVMSDPGGPSGVFENMFRSYGPGSQGDE